MLKIFNTHCPTKDETVSLAVNYICARCLEDTGKTPYAKGTIKSCSHYDGNKCNSCQVHSVLPQEIYQ